MLLSSLLRRKFIWHRIFHYCVISVFALWVLADAYPLCTPYDCQCRVGEKTLICSSAINNAWLARQNTLYWVEKLDARHADLGIIDFDDSFETLLLEKFPFLKVLDARGTSLSCSLSFEKITVLRDCITSSTPQSPAQTINWRKDFWNFPKLTFPTSRPSFKFTPFTLSLSPISFPSFSPVNFDSLERLKDLEELLNKTGNFSERHRDYGAALQRMFIILIMVPFCLMGVALLWLYLLRVRRAMTEGTEVPAASSIPPSHAPNQAASILPGSASGVRTGTGLTNR